MACPFDQSRPIALHVGITPMELSKCVQAAKGEKRIMKEVNNLLDND